MDIKDPKNAKNIQAILREGKSSEFWQVICAFLDEDIEKHKAELMSDEFFTAPAEQYKVQAEVIKNHILDLQTLKDFPDECIIELDEPDQTETEYDPFEKLETEPSQ